MKDNVIVTESGNEIYESEIYRLVDEYINSLDNPENIYGNNKGMFTGMLKYIYINYIKHNPIDYSDADMVYNIWTVYTILCYKYNKRPTILNFSILSGIDNTTINSWKNGECRQYIYYDSDNNRILDLPAWRLAHPEGEYRKKPSLKHSQTAKKMLEECEAALYDGATEQNSIGCIFALKANYGYTETAPVPTVNQNQRVLSASELPKLAEIPQEGGENGGLVEHNS